MPEALFPFPGLGATGLQRRLGSQHDRSRLGLEFLAGRDHPTDHRSAAAQHQTADVSGLVGGQIESPAVHRDKAARTEAQVERARGHLAPQLAVFDRALDRVFGLERGLLGAGCRAEVDGQCLREGRLLGDHLTAKLAGGMQPDPCRRFAFGQQERQGRAPEAGSVDPDLGRDPLGGGILGQGNDQDVRGRAFGLDPLLGLATKLDPHRHDLGEIDAFDRARVHVEPEDPVVIRGLVGDTDSGNQQAEDRETAGEEPPHRRCGNLTTSARKINP